jgi:DNA-binding NtrC family response regulator
LVVAETTDLWAISATETMASGTKIRLLTRLLEASDAPLWAIGPTGQLVYLSAGCTDWLGVELESLVDRRSVAGAPVSDDPLDRLAASLSPPQGLASRGTASMRVQPPAIGAHRPTPLEARFVRVGSGESAITIGIGGTFDDRIVDTELHDAIALRQKLDAWRKQRAALATIATAGVSGPARRMRRRLQVAAITRTDVGFFGPTGCGSESIAARIHELSAAGESCLTVDGPLMDAELLDATLTPLVHQLTDSSQAKATALIRGLDEMPYEAQARLVAMLDTFSGRLRLLALCGPHQTVLAESLEEQESSDDPDLEEASGGICSELIEILSALTIVIQPLAARVEDIPLLATAMLDARHAAGEGTAERLSRAALDALVIYPWPRNIDELDEAIRHAVGRSMGETIAAEHLPLAIRSYRPGEIPRTSPVSLDDAVERYELRLINEAIEGAGGNRAEAARWLGISRARLLRRIDEQSKKRPTHSGDEAK